jgi:D-alanyl-D-alanine carboxypeptidase
MPAREIKYLIFSAILALALTASPAWAKKRVAHKKGGHAVHRHIGAAVDAGASYADIVIDAESGRILHATDADKLRHPASLTKMMTLYLTFQALESGKININQYLPVSENAAAQSPSKLGLRAGQRIRVEDAILGLVTESANDAAVTLGEWLGGSEEGFAQMMTRQAHALGMNGTQFRNPSGLPDPDQVTTARDMAVLGDALIYHFPQYYAYFSHDNFTYAGIPHHNHNHLMDRYDGMDGIKTGYIRASGFNLVASARRGTMRLVGVVFGGRSAVARDNHMAQLLDQGFMRAHSEKVQARAVPTAMPPVTPQAPPQPAPTQQAAADNEAEGDGSDVTNDVMRRDYVTLPAKGINPFAVAKVNVNLAAPMRDGAKRGNEVTGGDWGVQIGAYSDADIGRQALTSLIGSMPQLLGSAEPEVQKIANGKNFLYRARLMSLDHATAQTVCSYMVQHGQACLTVGP